MKKHGVVARENPATCDLLTEVLRQGAVTLLAGAVGVELEEFLTLCEALRDAGGRQRLARNGYLLARDSDGDRRRLGARSSRARPATVRRGADPFHVEAAAPFPEARQEFGRVAAVALL